MRRTILAILICALATACWAPSNTRLDGSAMTWGCDPITYDVDGDASFSDSVRTIAAQVQEVSGHALVEAPSAKVHIRHSWPEGSPSASGWTDVKSDGTHYYRGTIFIHPSITGEYELTVIRHEFGHLLGMAHSAYAGSIMHDPLTQTDFTDVDAVALRTLGAC